MKILVCTVPIRPEATEYPPLGAMAVVSALRGAGYAPVFFDIDAERPSLEAAIDRIVHEAPDVVAISAVVSTAYRYVKDLALGLRQRLPEAVLIVGGNLAASAELLHRCCGVDFCVIGEGERVIVNLMNRCSQCGDFRALRGIRGITFLNDGEMVFTGYEAAIPAAELKDPDYSILEEYSRIEHFVTSPMGREDFRQDPRSLEPHRKGKTMATVISAKGCVARCTFCHRWDKGYRQFAPERIVAHIRTLMERYNVGFIHFGDENFGSDREATGELIRLLKPLDILWVVGGVRARSVDRDLLIMMREAGCVAVYYGFETGSAGMLQVMEKNLELRHNLDAARWTREAGLYTCYQLILGMPGETPETVAETILMLKAITQELPRPPYHYMSVNYIQALPGTPVYELARARGLIGPTLEDEAAYLERISDIDAADDTKFLNFTDYPYMVVRSWRIRLLYEVTAHWHRKHRVHADTEIRKDGYFNIHELRTHPMILRIFYPVRGLLIAAETLRPEFRNSSWRVLVSRLWEVAAWLVAGPSAEPDYGPLRRILKENPAPSSEAMRPLRLGR